jgi:hypothetical protein
VDSFVEGNSRGHGGDKMGRTRRRLGFTPRESRRGLRWEEAGVAEEAGTHPSCLPEEDSGEGVGTWYRGCDWLQASLSLSCFFRFSSLLFRFTGNPKEKRKGLQIGSNNILELELLSQNHFNGLQIFWFSLNSKI